MADELGPAQQECLKSSVGYDEQDILVTISFMASARKERNQPAMDDLFGKLRLQIDALEESYTQEINTPQAVVKGQVIRQASNGYRYVAFEDRALLPGEHILTGKPHEEGTEAQGFDYLCGDRWCRCGQ